VNLVHGLATRGDRYAEDLVVVHVTPDLDGRMDDHSERCRGVACLGEQGRCQGGLPDVERFVGACLGHFGVLELEQVWHCAGDVRDCLPDDRLVGVVHFRDDHWLQGHYLGAVSCEPGRHRVGGVPDQGPVFPLGRGQVFRLDRGWVFLLEHVLEYAQPDGPEPDHLCAIRGLPIVPTGCSSRRLRESRQGLPDLIS